MGGGGGGGSYCLLKPGSPSTPALGIPFALPLHLDEIIHLVRERLSSCCRPMDLHHHFVMMGHVTTNCNANSGVDEIVDSVQ